MTPEQEMDGIRNKMIRLQRRDVLTGAAATLMRTVAAVEDLQDGTIDWTHADALSVTGKLYRIAEELAENVTMDATTRRLGSPVYPMHGPVFWPFDPRPEEVDVRDIGFGLGRNCRFGGHAPRFYPVAEHVLRVAWLTRHLAEKRGIKLNIPAQNYAALLYADTAYSGHMPASVLKHMPALVGFADKIQTCIMRAFHLPPPTIEASELVEEARGIVEVIELRQLFIGAEHPCPDIVITAETMKAASTNPDHDGQDYPFGNVLRMAGRELCTLLAGQYQAAQVRAEEAQKAREEAKEAPIGRSSWVDLLAQRHEEVYPLCPKCQMEHPLGDEYCPAVEEAAEIDG